MKRTLRISAGIIYLGIFTFSLIVLLNPDLPLFYAKQQIENQNLVSVGDIFTYQFNIDTHFYNPGTISVLEDQHALTLNSSEDTTSLAKGSFVIESVDENKITIEIAPTTVSNPPINGQSYSIYIRPYLISSNLAGAIFLLLLLGVIVFLSSCLADLKRRNLLLSSPLGVVELWVNLFDHPANASKVRFSKPHFKPDFELFKRCIVNTLLIAFLYAFMEWVFFVTKPSFMDLLAWSDKVKIFLITGLVVALLSLLTLAVIALLDFLLSPFFPSLHRYALHFPAAFLLTCLCLILLDNFTYTILNFGIVDTMTLLRVLYGLGFIGLLVYFIKQLAAARDKPENRLLNTITSTNAIVLITVSLILVGFTFKNNNDLSPAEQNSSIANKPNVILFGTDGLNAANMSLYGYSRDTTPYINTLANSSLVSQNNFSNAGNSQGSDTATLTGKSPLATRVLFPPNALRGIDEYQHLPGVLKINGYRTVFLGLPYYDDVNAANFQDAFDVVNCKENDISNPFSFASQYGFDDENYFFKTLEDRILERVNHIFFIADMVNPYAVVTQNMSDQARIECLYSELNRAKQTGQPLFVQIHLEGTHGDAYNPINRDFSKGEKDDADWMTDFYDDSILDYDSQVNDLVKYLNENGQYGNTLVILYTDHAQEWYTTKKIPLLFHFPNDQYAGAISQNTQNLDIAPTILDYLNIERPAWMEGSSLLNNNLDSNRLILDPQQIDTTHNNAGNVNIPPFYQFGILTVIQCQNWFTFDLRKDSITHGVVDNYVDPCPANSLDSTDVIRQKVRTILRQNGFNIPDNW
jgi:arylsulfatase A-like enzyme